MNVRPLPPQGSALPTAPHPDDNILYYTTERHVSQEFFEKNAARCEKNGRLELPPHSPELFRSALQGLGRPGKSRLRTIRGFPAVGETERLTYQRTCITARAYQFFREYSGSGFFPRPLYNLLRICYTFYEL